MHGGVLFLEIAKIKKPPWRVAFFSLYRFPKKRIIYSAVRAPYKYPASPAHVRRA